MFKAWWELCCLGFLGMLHIPVDIKEGAFSDMLTEQVKYTDTSVSIILISNVQRVNNNIGGATSTAHEMLGRAYGHQGASIRAPLTCCEPANQTL